QFWSFANDLYSKDEGERLFPIVQFGASFGAVVGAAVAGSFFEKLGPYVLLLVGAGLLVLEAALHNLIYVRDGRPGRSAASAAIAKEPAVRGGAFGMVVRTRYLLLIALMLLLHNAVKTTGDFLLGYTLQADALAKLGAHDPEGVKRLIGADYSN